MRRDKVQIPSVLLMRAIDVDEMASKVAEIVVSRIQAEISKGQHAGGLVDRKRMAALAGVSVSSIDRLVKAGTIPSSAVGSKRLFDPDAVLSAMKGGDDVKA